MNWRREQLADIDKLVQTEQDAGKTLPGLGLSEACARLRQIVEGGRGFVLGGGATQGQLEAALDAVRVDLPFLLQAGGEGFRTLVHERIVEHEEGLQRRRARDAHR